MKRILPTMKLGLCLALFAGATSTSAEHLQVILLGGQSNMAGISNNAADLPVSLQSPQADVLFYHNDFGLTTLRPGSGLVVDAFGPEVTFGRTIADAQPTQNFALIKYAAGGTSLATAWDPTSGSIYSAFRTTVSNGLDALTSAGHTYDISAMLWTQGETDAQNGSLTYEADLNEFIADVRSRYGTDLPFFLSRLSSSQTSLDATALANIRTAQSNVASSDPNAYLIDTDNMLTDGLHFKSQGQIDLGEAFGAAYINAVPEPGSLVILSLGGLVMGTRRRCGSV